MARILMELKVHHIQNRYCGQHFHRKQYRHKTSFILILVRTESFFIPGITCTKNNYLCISIHNAWNYVIDQIKSFWFVRREINPITILCSSTSNPKDSCSAFLFFFYFRLLSLHHNLLLTTCL